MTKVSKHHQIYIVKQMNVCGGYVSNSKIYSPIILTFSWQRGLINIRVCVLYALRILYGCCFIAEKNMPKNCILS